MAKRWLGVLKRRIAVKRINLVELIVVLCICFCCAIVYRIHVRSNRFDLIRLQIQGRNLYAMLVTMGLDKGTDDEWLFWPNNASNNFSNSTDYFSWLLDMEHFGRTNWNPILVGVAQESVFSSIQSKSLVKDTLWSVAKNITSNTVGSVPVLVSKNCDVTQLFGRRSFDKPHGELKSYGGCVMFRKDGSSFTAVKNSYSASYLYRSDFFDYTTNALSVKQALMYITPVGERFPQQ